MGTKNGDDYQVNDRRSESRSIDDQYSSVEFSISNVTYLYQFRIWDTSASGMSILVREDSEVLKHIEVGDILEMKYYLKQSPGEPVTLQTEIRHITKDVPERVKGHFLVGLLVHEKN